MASGVRFERSPEVRGGSAEWRAESGCRIAQFVGHRGLGSLAAVCQGRKKQQRDSPALAQGLPHCPTASLRDQRADHQDCKAPLVVAGALFFSAAHVNTWPMQPTCVSRRALSDRRPGIYAHPRLATSQQPMRAPSRLNLFVPVLFLGGVGALVYAKRVCGPGHCGHVVAGIVA